MTKHILRIVVTVVILAGVGLLLYFFVFKPTNTDTTFNALKDLETYKQHGGYSNAMLSIKESDVGQPIYGDDGKIINIREKILGATSGVGNADDTPSFVIVEKGLEEVYSYYVNYFLFAEDVSNKQDKSLKEKIASYKSSLQTVSNSIQAIMEYESAIMSSGTVEGSSSALEAIKQELENKYTTFANSYKDSFKKYNDLIIELRSIVADKVFDGEFLYDAHATYLDVILLFSNGFSSSETEATESSGLQKAFIVYNKFVELKVSEDEFFNEKASKFVNAYLNLAKKFSKDLELVSNASFIQDAINELAHLPPSGLSGYEGFRSLNLNQDAYTDLKTLLTYIGLLGS